MEILSKIKHRTWNFFHFFQKRRYRKNFTNPNISIISMNCVGGILYHDLGLEFKSPTINLYMKALDFIKFCENLREYLEVDTITECTDPSIIGKRKYPIGILKDIYLYFVHYKSIEEAQLKWNSRKKRINWDNILIICSDRDGMTSELKDRFEKLQFKKIMFTHKTEKRGTEFVYIPGYENQGEVGIVTEPKGWFGKRAVDKVDWITKLN